jgi:hypothetical protein
MHAPEIKFFYENVQKTSGSESQLTEKPDHVYIEKLMWDCQYYLDGRTINPDMFNDAKTPPPTDISEVRDWFWNRGMPYH